MTFTAGGRMEIRELVRLKKGVGGLDPPNNLAILLDRFREGGETMARIHTLRGTLTVKWGSVAEGLGTVYEGPKDDLVAMSRLLRDASERERTTETLQIDPQQILDTKTLKDLWTTLWDHIGKHPESGRPQGDLTVGGLHPRSFTPEEIGSIHFRPKLIGPKHVQAVGKLLSSADGPHSPYFFRAPTGRGAFYIPYTREAMAAAEEDAASLQRLRSHLIADDSVEQEDERGTRTVKVRRTIYDDLSNLPLDERDREALLRVCAWASYYIERASWPTVRSSLKHTRLGESGPFTLGGTQMRSLDKFDLERFTSLLFMDLARSRSDELASNVLKVLLEMGLLTWAGTSEAVIDHKLASGARKFHRDFSQHVLDAASRLPKEVLPRDREGREDLTGLLTYTIDPSDAKDFDDAVSLEPLPDGGFAIWVHIADVSHYVRPGDLVDAEARFRATSVYLPTGVLPMLPPVLSEELCSLKAGVERLALSTKMVLGPDLSLKEYAHCQSIINVRENLNYEQVEGYIIEGREPFTSLDDLATGLSAKVRRLSLETPERRVRFPQEDRIDVTIKRPTRATKLIEELMVLCNECAARTIGGSSLPTAYRVHPLPDRQSVERFNGSCSALGLNVAIPEDWLEGQTEEGGEGGADGGEQLLKALLSGGKVSFGALSAGISEDGTGVDPSEPPEGAGPDIERMGRAVDAFNYALDLIREQAEGATIDLLNIRLLRVLPRALYSDRNMGHFGLRSERYCHFTSPIRRYADVLAHRTVKYILARDGKGPPVPWDAPTEEEVASLLENLNDMSSSAEEWEREMVSVALATRAVMDPSFKDMSHSARLVSLIPSAAFFLMDDSVTEGRIPMSQLSPLRLSLDPTESFLTMDPEDNIDTRSGMERVQRSLGEREGPEVFMRLGEHVGCTVRSVSLVDGRIDLSLTGRATRPMLSENIHR